jgi:hypothetical protein
MNLFRFRQFLALGACGLLATLGGCDKATTAGGSDEIDTRLAVDRAGHPVAGARISLLKAGDSTGKVVAVNATADDGSYPEFRVPDGFYSVLVRDDADSLGKFVDSLQIESHKVPNGRDTLLSLGSVRGVVRVAQGHSPATVTVGLLGTDIVANVKSDGTFKIELVPGSLYTLAAIPSLEGYGPLYKRIQLKDGQDLTLPDTLVMPVTGLPVPGGMSVSEDSMTGNVRLVWNRVDHPDLLGYVLDRVEGGVVTSSRYLTDTTWTDSLSGYWEGQPILGPWPSREVAYRVRSRSLSGLPDSRNAASTFTVKPPTWTSSMTVPEPNLSQDSTSGNVQLSWPVVGHPRLRGYVVERIVGGVVVASSILHDTAYLDSLGRHWDALPLSGPWPDLDVRYRIAAIAKDTARGAAASLSCHAPKWVRSVDSTRISVTQDSLTGNVRIHWNPSKHPHSAGYRVERTENGVVWSGLNSIDTNYVDSLGAYWATLPLLGPWPARTLSYRIRLVADSRGTDGWSASFAIKAKPPEWTKHVDSVEASLRTDIVTGARIVAWNAPLHPDLAGWTVTRSVNGLQDCSTQLVAGEWNDSGCPDPVCKVVDSAIGTLTGERTLVNECQSAGLSYALSTVRNRGISEHIVTVGRRDSVAPLVEWRDSVLSSAKTVHSLRTIGGWLKIEYANGGGSWISKDGVNWESFPGLEGSPKFPDVGDNYATVGDSVWIVRKLDSLNWLFKSRTGLGQWYERTIQPPSGACTRSTGFSLTGLWVDSGVPVFDCNWSSELWKWDNSGWRPFTDFPVSRKGYMIGSYSLLDGTSLAVIGSKLNSEKMIYRRGAADSKFSLVVDQASSDASFRYNENGDVASATWLMGALQTGEFLFETRTTSGSGVVARSSSGRSFLIPYPVSGSPNGLITRGVWNNEIWLLDPDNYGHLWKGKLNLPK